MTSTQHESKVLLVSTKGKNEREEMEETRRRRRSSGQHWRNSGWTYCEGVGDVVGVEAPLGGVAQVIFHGVQVVEVGLQVRVHQDRGEEEEKHRWK